MPDDAPNPPAGRPARRMIVGRLLEAAFSPAGLEALKARNWTLTGVGLVALGLVSDLMQIFGEVSYWGLVVSAAAAALFGAVVLLRLRGCAGCAVPFVAALVMSGLFGGLYAWQKDAEATEAGILVSRFPEASAIQNAIYGRLGKLLNSQDDANAKLDEILARLERQDPDADPATIAAFRDAIESLAKSGDARKQKALKKLADDDKAAALKDLTRLAEDQSEAAADSAREAAETWKQIGALAFLDDTQKALDAYRKAADLAPDDPAARNQLGHLLRRTGALDDAAAAYQQILDGPGATDRTWQAIALGNLGLIEQTRGNLDAAEDYHKRSLAIAEALGRKEGMAKQLGNLGLIEKTRGNLDAAEDYLKRSLAIDEALGRKEGVAITLANLGGIEADRPNIDAACALWRRSAALFGEAGAAPHQRTVAGWIDAGCSGR